jgi:hypothetical protein
VQKRLAVSKPDFAHKGVRLRESGCWEARVCFKGTKTYVGIYDSAKLAAAAHDAALAKIKEANTQGVGGKEEEAAQGPAMSRSFSLSARFAGATGSVRATTAGSVRATTAAWVHSKIAVFFFHNGQ